MEEFLKIVEKPSSSEIDIESDRLKFFNTKLKIWDYANVSFEEQQKCSFDNRSAILRNYYSKMCNRYPGRGIFFVIFFLRLLLFFVWLSFFYEASFLIFVLDESNLGLLPMNSFKSANLVSMRKSATEDDRNLITKIVAVSFGNYIGPAEVLVRFLPLI